ncbi:MAG TPA: hypothetical protein P5040_02035 [Smithella sp.]|nr:hypothetical protein [Smithella sp.]HRS96934.1 hypothetical protein [Smithella sp.]
MEPFAAPKQKSEGKRDFSPEEHEKAKAVCEFVIELTKAISRSGYYDADHPVSLDVKKGLYEKFQDVLAASAELMLTCHEHAEGEDIHISGILNEPFNIRKLTHATTSDLFVPKLKDYFERKSLNSFVIKKSITPEHFEAFIDVMSEPIADSADPSKLGEYLTKKLAELNITEISTVFKTDIVLSRGKLPWRVSIILRRLAKDLKVIPLFRQASEEKIKLIKKQIVEDIIRPLNNSGLLRDLIVNCDIIVEHVHHLMEVDELETTIVNALPVNEVLPVSVAVYEFYQDYLKDVLEEKSAGDERKIFLEKMLNIAAKKMIHEKIPNAAELLERVYEDGIVAYDDLPEEFRFRIETKKLAEDILNRPDFYLNKMERASSADETEKLFSAFQRAMAELVDKREWAFIDKIIRKSKELALGKKPGFPEAELSPPDDVFAYSHENFAREYVRGSAEERKSMNAILIQLDEMFLKIVDDVLNIGKDPDVLKNMADLLSQKGNLARRWALKALENQNQSLSLLNIALLVLLQVGEEQDFRLMEKYIRYPHHSIRYRALAVAAKLSKREAEHYLVDALKDDHEVIREHAAAIIERDIIPSELAANKIIIFVKAKLQENKELLEKEVFSLASLIRSIGKNTALEKNLALEHEIIAMIAEAWKGKSGVLKFIKAEPTAAEKEIVSACLFVLGKIGAERTEEYLKTFAKGAGVLSDDAVRALEEVSRRKKTP